MFFPYPIKNGQTLSEWSIEHLAPSRDEAKFLAFLSLYGSKGVHLRDLITFATLRTYISTSKSHWLLSGEPGPILRPVGDSSLPTHCSFLNAFVREVRGSWNVHDLEYRLLGLGLIEAEDPARYTYFDRDKDHRQPENRIWRVVENQLSSHLMVSKWHDLDGEDMVMDLLYVFIEMPNKDVSLLAERHREAFYLHARIFALETLRFSQTILKDAREYTVALILQILTHRSQNGDEKLLQLAKACPSSANGFDWTIMVLWAELKNRTNSGDLKVESAFDNRIMRLLSWKGKRQGRTNGLTGYLLVEWLKAAESSPNSELNGRIVKYAMDWVERAWSSGSPIEHAALCCVLANFRMLDKSVLVLPRYHSLYGYYLSRTSHPEQAQEFLTSGLARFRRFQLSNGSWQYQFELVSVLIRLGRQQEAEVWLADISKHMKSLDNIAMDLSYGELERENLSEYAETRILIDLYEADLLMAAGQLDHAASRLENQISSRYPMKHRGEIGEDVYVGSLLLAFKMRLLEVRPLVGSPDSALQVATELVTEVRDQLSLEVDAVQWILEQLLTLSNRLVWAGNVPAASYLLEISLKVFRCHPCSDSLKDLLQYAEERMVTVSNMLISDRAVEDPTIVGLESSAVSRILSMSEKATSELDNVIAEIPHPMNKTSSGLRIEAKSYSQEVRDRRRSTLMKEHTEKAPLAKLTAPRKTSRREPDTKKLVQRRLRNSVAAMLRRAPRAPTTEIANPVLEHSAPVRRVSELRTA